MSARNTLLSVNNLKAFGLKPVTFELRAGEIASIEGASGSGKSVLLRALADLDAVEGTIALRDQDRSSMSGPNWRKRVRYVAAEPGWWAETARDHFPNDVDLDKQVSALGLAPEKLDQSVSRLSTGERQRLALLRSVIDEPDVLLLDEPTGALDAKSTRQVEQLLKRLRKAGAAFLLVSHDPAQIKRLASRRFVIRNGALREARK